MLKKRASANSKDRKKVEACQSKRKLKNSIVRQQKRRIERLEKMKPIEYKKLKAFENGMLTRGLTPVDNDGDGNCIFMSLA